MSVSSESHESILSEQSHLESVKRANASSV